MIPFSQPCYSAADRRAWAEALKPMENADECRRQVERELHRRLGSHLPPISTNSCTSAMMLFGLHRPFRRYFVPALSWYSTWSWTPVNARIHYDFNCMQLPSLHHTDMGPDDLLVIVDLYGRAQLLDDYLVRFLDKQASRPTILIDSAHNLLSPFHKRWLNNQSVDAIAYSFGPIKQCSAVRGGALCLSHSQSAAFPRLMCMMDSGSLGRDGMTPFGWNLEMGEPNAALLLSQLKTFERRQVRTHEILQAYRSRIHRAPHLADDLLGESGHIAVVWCGTPRDADHLRNIMAAADVMTGWHYPMARYLDPLQFPTAWSLSQRVVTIPCWAGMTPAQVAQVCSALDIYLSR